MELRSVLIGAIATVVILSCSSPGYVYHNYDLDVASLADPEKGFMRGPAAAQDLDLRICLPTAASKSPCTAMMTTEWFKAQAEIDSLKQRLNACEHGPAPTPTH